MYYEIKLCVFLRLYPRTDDDSSFTEDYLHNVSNSCIIKLGLFGETVVNQMMDFDFFQIS
ncbi:hypothetical protein [Acetobacterium sp.]|uniref:hypothetical protein n=1 Tax=Acetobacterium sp. TaxID=1872094 RepID=UPI00271A913C|nr:hypothetical protein [Acetobacterium sp.]MDO9493270.1 hypothetical protein [Acetobacterium sp.]